MNLPILNSGVRHVRAAVKIWRRPAKPGRFLLPPGTVRGGIKPLPADCLYALARDIFDPSGRSVYHQKIMI